MRKLLTRCLVISVILSCLLFVHTQFSVLANEDLDQDGIADRHEQNLLNKYAPVYYFHLEEKYFPDSVDEYLGNAELRFHYRLRKDDAILAKGEVNQQTMISQRHRNKDALGRYTDEFISSKDFRDTYNHGGFFLEVPDDLADKDSVYFGDQNLDRTPIYATAYRCSKGTINLQYWLFYPYNLAPAVAGVRLNHEGDWEHITIRLDKSENISEVYFASHNDEGESYLLDSIEVHKGTHPVVYSALGTHASFVSAGVQDRGWYLPSDYTGKGAFLDATERVLNVGDGSTVLSNQDFILYGGLWGEIGNTTISTGPKTPSYQSSWQED